MKKLHVLIPSLVATGLGAILPLASCNQIQNKIDSIKISGEQQVIKGSEATYSAEVTVTSDEVDKTVTWSIKTDQGETGSTIDAATGKFTAGNKVGTVTIEATSVVDETKTAEFTINVVSAITSITISKIDDLIWNDEWTCKATVESIEGYDQTVTWDIVEEDVTATITPDTGLLKAGEKTETITVRATSVADKDVSATQTVNIISPVKSIVISGSVEKYFTDDETYSAEIDVEGGWSNTVKWSIISGEAETGSSIDSSTGKFKAGKKAGTVVIKAESDIDSTVFDTYEIQVVSPITGVTIAGIDDMGWGDEHTCVANVEGVEGYKTVKWEIVETDTGAEIDESTGKLTAGNKTETITVKATSVVDETKFATQTVNIISPVKSITIDKQTQALPIEGGIDYSATVDIEGSWSKKVVWDIIEDESGTGSSIDESGHFTAGNKTGKVVIKATSIDETKFATLDVYITEKTYNPIKSVQLESDNAIVFGQSTVCVPKAISQIEGIYIACEINHCVLGETGATWDANTSTLTAGNTKGTVQFLVRPIGGYTISSEVVVHIAENVFTFSTSGGNATITGVADTTYTSVSVLPTITDGSGTYNVTTIGSSAFHNSSNINLVNLKTATNLTTIGRMAFFGSTITSIYIPKSVTRIEEYAICNTLVEDIFIESDSQLELKEEDRYVFATDGSNVPHLKTINLENATKTTCLPYSSIQNTLIETITIPESVNKIAEYVFFACNKLTTINFAGTKAQWKAINRESDNWHSGVPTSIVHCKDGHCGLDDK